MTIKLKTTHVLKSNYINYLKRAEECIHAARIAFATQEWNASEIEGQVSTLDKKTATK